MIHFTSSIPLIRDITSKGNSTASTTGATSSSSSSSSGGGALTQAAGGPMGETQFLQLLVSEMKNQDPTNPMDGTQLATQLAQFSSVEQLTTINSKLGTITQLLTPANSSSGTTKTTS